MEQYHPINNFIYFCLVIGCSMFLMHPICLGISLVSGGIYTLHLFGWKRARKGLLSLGFLMLLTAVMNPAFSHQGVTVLTYLPTGNVLTLESIWYGIAAACMLAATLLWFRCMSEILTADKIVYLFGRGFPVLGLILSMILGFIPKMQRKLSEIRICGQGKRQQEEKNIYTRNYGKVSIACRKRWLSIRCGIENISILITWALEDAVEMADSMKSRGYGLEGRTFYTVYRFTKRDGRLLAALLLEAFYIFSGSISGGIKWEYYPQTEGAGFEIYAVSIYLVYLFMCMTPVIVDWTEERKWSRLRSVI